MSVRRNIKNVVYNYSEAARKAREATSNDPWGPSTSLMQELADLTYNMAAYNDIMPIVWKRLNDHGKNWRHVYKSLVLLDYLVRYGSKRITQQCKENIFVIQTLKDFQYIEGNRDQGQNVREKAKQLVALLKDDERLKNERAKAEALKQRMMQDYTLASSGRGYAQTSASLAGARSSGYGLYQRGSSGYVAPIFGYQDGSRQGRNSSVTSTTVAKEYAAPKDAEEEAMQVQLALALSKEEAEEEERQRKSDYIKMSMAVDESLKTTPAIEGYSQRTNLDSGKNASENDLLSILDGLSFNQSQSPSGGVSHMVNRPVSANPWISQPNANSRLSSDDVWGIPSTPWTPFTTGTTKQDVDAAWNETNPPQTSTLYDEVDQTNRNRLDSFDVYNLIGVPPSNNQLSQPEASQDNADFLGALASGSSNELSATGNNKVDYFLGEHAPLVDLNNLTAPDYNTQTSNPFVLSSMMSTKTSTNPFIENAVKPPTLNQLSQQTSRQAPHIGFQTTFAADAQSGDPALPQRPSSTLPPPLIPTTSSKPFSPKFNAPPL